MIKNIFICSPLTHRFFLCTKDEKIKILWLLTLIILTLMTIALGAYTRLSGSGLSMVDWHLIKGIIPPITHKQWLESFEMYQQFPEYQLKNMHIKLSDYQSIYLVEYSHRLLGRLIGLVCIVPFLIFLWTKKLNKTEIIHGILLIFLVAVQGAMGWYMVKSGLVDVPRVSHYRLTIHFFLALIFMTYANMLVLAYAGAFEKKKSTLNVSYTWSIVLILLIVQSVLGTFTAGLDGGLVSKDYPKMFGQWVPLAQIFPQNKSIGQNFLENPSTIQFFHRHLGVLIALIIAVFCGKQLIKKGNSSDKLIYKITLNITMLLPILGIATVVTQVNFFLAIIHQLAVVALFQCIVFLWISHKCRQRS